MFQYATGILYEQQNLEWPGAEYHNYKTGKTRRVDESKNLKRPGAIVFAAKATDDSADTASMYTGKYRHRRVSMFTPTLTPVP